MKKHLAILVIAASALAALAVGMGAQRAVERPVSVYAAQVDAPSS
jgi:hypothetical protein